MADNKDNSNASTKDALIEAVIDAGKKLLNLEDIQGHTNDDGYEVELKFKVILNDKKHAKTHTKNSK